MTKVRIVLQPNLPTILNRQTDVRLIVRTKAEQAADIARSIAPRVTGAYANSIGVEQETDGVRLEATDFKAHWIEWGTIYTRAHATLRSASQRVARIIEN